MADQYFPAPARRIYENRHWRQRVRLPSPVGGLASYELEFHWNDRVGLWSLDFSDSSGVALVVQAQIVLTGDLFAPYRYKPLPPGRVFVREADARATGAEAGIDDLFTRVLIGYEEAA